MLYINIVKRVNPKSSHHKENFFSSILYLYEMMDIHQTYCDDHFMMFVSHIFMLYTLNLYSAACHLYLNKTGRKSMYFFIDNSVW